MLLTRLTRKVPSPSRPAEGGSQHTPKPGDTQAQPCPQLQEPLHLHTLVTPWSSFLSLITLLPVQATCACSNQRHSGSIAPNWPLPPTAKVAHSGKGCRVALATSLGQQLGWVSLLMSGTRTRSMHHSGATPEHVNNTSGCVLVKRANFGWGDAGRMLG